MLECPVQVDTAGLAIFAVFDGSQLVVEKSVNSASTILGAAPFSATGGTSNALRFRAVGSTLYAKVQVQLYLPGAYRLANNGFSRPGFTSMLTPQPEIAIAIRAVNRDSGN